MPNLATARRCGGRCIARSCRMPWGSRQDLTVFLGTPDAASPPAPRRGRAPAHAAELAPDTTTRRGTGLGPRSQPPRHWRLVSLAQRHESAVAGAVLRDPRHARPRLARATPRAGSVAALRTRSRADAAHEVLLGRSAADRAARTLVRLAHQRWAIEQQYQELKDELGLDHFEGRSLPGWERHVVLTALAYSLLAKRTLPAPSEHG